MTRKPIHSVGAGDDREYGEMEHGGMARGVVVVAAALTR